MRANFTRLRAFLVAWTTPQPRPIPRPCLTIEQALHDYAEAKRRGDTRAQHAAELAARTARTWDMSQARAAGRYEKEAMS